MAGVAPVAVIMGAAPALSPLEGRAINVSEGRETVAELVSVAGLELLDRDFGGTPDRAGALPATTLTLVEASPILSRKLGGQTIAEVAAQSEQEFIVAAVKGVGSKALKGVTEDAKAVWAAAKRVAEAISKPH